MSDKTLILSVIIIPRKSLSEGTSPRITVRITHEIEEILDILSGALNKHEGTEEEKDLHKYYVHIKTRYCKYQVRHHELTGSYYLIDRVRKHL